MSLYNLPLWLLYLILIGFSIALCIGGTCIARWQNWRLNAENFDTASAIHAFVGTVYAIMLALIIADIQGEYHEVENAVVEEASATGDLYRNLHSLAQPERERFQSAVRDYVRQVIFEEWPVVQRGGRSDETWQRIDRFARAILDFHPATAQEQRLYPQILSDLDRVLDARRQRLHRGTQGLNQVTWMTIVAGGIITLGFFCFFPVHRLRAHLTLIGAMAVLFGLMISLIVAMDRPLRGQFSIQPEAFLRLDASFVRLRSTLSDHQKTEHQQARNEIQK